MQNDERNDEGQAKSVDASKKESKSIFSEEEIEATVKGFVLAWIRKEVKITFPTAKHLIEQSKIEGKKINSKEALAQEVIIKTRFTDLIMICSGVKPSTPEEQQKAIADLFNHILLFRCGDRIDGQFVEYSVEKRLHRLEQGLKVTNELVEQLVALHRQELGI